MKKLISILTLIICLFCFPACKKGGETLSVYAPDGAPALALAYSMKEVGEVSYNVVDSKVIKAKVTGENPLADVAVVPINTASLELGNGAVYQMLGVVTHGNFYFLSKLNKEINRDNISDLLGKTIGVVQLPNVPGLTLKVALSGLGIEYNELINNASPLMDKVNLLAITPNEIGVTPCDYYLAPSPVADIKAGVKSLNFVGSLHSLLLSGGFPQAVIVAKKSVLNANFDKVKEIVNAIKQSGNYLKIQNKNEICSLINGNLEEGLTSVFNQNNLTENAILRANINFVLAKDCKGEVNEFIQKLKAIKDDLSLFSEEFFYNGDF